MIRIGLMLMVLPSLLVGVIAGAGGGGLGTVEIAVLMVLFVTGVVLIAQGVTKYFRTQVPKSPDDAEARAD